MDESPVDSAAVVSEYLAGAAIPELCHRHHIDEFTLYQMLRASPRVSREHSNGGPSTGNDDTDALIAGLYALLARKRTRSTR